MYDIAIIGAGVTGCAVARYLSRYKADICVLERDEDVCCGTSKANSGIVHAGYDAEHGSLMSTMNLRGSRMMEALSEELSFSYKKNGSLVLCLSEEDMPRLRRLYENGVENGVEGLEIVQGDRLHELEPNVSKNAVAALWAPTGAIVCPFGLTIALAENAAANGVEFKFNTQVTGLTKTAEGWAVQTNNGVVDAKCIVNAAGVYADVFHNMVSANKIHITPRRGDYCLLDKTAGGFVTHTLFQLSTNKGKGVLIAPTVHGNIIVGPTAIDIEDREGTNTTAEGIDTLLAKAGQLADNIPVRQVITSFAGLRAHEDGHEFIIGEAQDAECFFDCAGIESPGLSSSPAIGEYVSELVRDKLGLEPDYSFVPERKGILDPKSLSIEDRGELVRRQPAYGRIICRCEGVSEGEIIDAIHRTPGAKSLDGIKRRTRAGSGRCQSGFCSPRVIEILARELGVGQNEITKSGGGSYIITGQAKDSLRG